MAVKKKGQLYSLVTIPTTWGLIGSALGECGNQVKDVQDKKKNYQTNNISSGVNVTNGGLLPMSPQHINICM